MNNGKTKKSLVARLGSKVSAWVADMFAHPYAQIGIILFCALWWIFKLPTDILTAGLSILAITLTQMVLNNQAEREADTHRRDVAMHTKLDELIAANRRAKNEFVGIEEREEDEIVQLKEQVKEAVHELPEGADKEVRKTAERVVEEAAEELKQAQGKQKDGAARKRRQTARR